jgi:hypothetical protein
VDERTSISRKTSRRGRGIKENPDWELIDAEVVKFPGFYKFQCSLRFPQQPASDPQSSPEESSQQPQILFI